LKEQVGVEAERDPFLEFSDDKMIITGQIRRIGIVFVIATHSERPRQQQKERPRQGLGP
jgi:hypothetical protein